MASNNHSYLKQKKKEESVASRSQCFPMVELQTEKETTIDGLLHSMEGAFTGKLNANEDDLTNWEGGTDHACIERRDVQF